MASIIHLRLGAFLFALQACSPAGKEAPSGTTTAPEGGGTTQPSGEQPPEVVDEKADPTLADQYIDAVGSGMVKDGAAQGDVDTLNGAVKNEMTAGQSSLRLDGGPDFNDPKTVFDQIPGLMVKHALEQKFDALLPKIVDQSAAFIGEKVSSNDKQGLFAAFSKSFMSSESDEQIAASAADFMKGLDKVVPEEQLGAATSDFYGKMFTDIKAVSPDFDFATHIEKLADASAAVSDSDIASDLFTKSLEIVANFVPADRLAESQTKLNDKATEFISALPKEEVAEKMAKLNTAVLANVDEAQAATMQAKIQEKIASSHPELNDAYKAELDKKLIEAKVDQTKIDNVNTGTADVIVCPTGTVKSEFGCKPVVTTPAGNENTPVCTATQLSAPVPCEILNSLMASKSKSCNSAGTGFVFGACVATSCKPGNSLLDGACVAAQSCAPNQVLDPMSCKDSIPFSTAAMKSATCNDAGSGVVFGECELVSCAPNYIVEGGQCVPNG